MLHSKIIRMRYLTSTHFLALFIVVIIPFIIYKSSGIHTAVTYIRENLPSVHNCKSEISDQLLSQQNKSWKTILFWHDWFGKKWSTGFGTEDAPGLRNTRCPSFRCEFTYDKSRIEEADAVVFRFSEIDPESFPLRTSTNQRWIYFNREAPTQEDAILKAMELVKMNMSHQINWTMTYHSNSPILAPYGHFTSLIDDEKVILRPSLMSEHQNTLVHYQHAISAKISIKEILGPSWRSLLIRPKIVAWMSSHCSTISGRETYVKELQKYIEVDIFGKCGTKECGERNPRGDWCWEDVLKPKYMFYLSMENVFCEDYITEKAYLPLEYYMVPIVFGGADYSRFLPPYSYINARDYHPQELAQHLTKLSQDPVAYSRYHIWRGYWKVQLGGTLCEMCHRLHMDEKHSYYSDLVDWRNKNGKCVTETNNTFGYTDLDLTSSPDM